MDDEDDTWVPPQKPGFTSYPGHHSTSTHQLEASLDPNESPLSRAKRMFSEAADLAAGSIIDIALHEQNPRLRLDAAKYITDRVMGPTTQVNPVDEDNPLDKLMRAYTNQAESYANNPGVGGNDA
jgi:hypothetical protein